MVVCLLASAFVALGTSSAQASFEYLCRAKTVDEVRACDDSGYADNMHKSWWRAYSGHNCTNYAGYRMSIAGVPTPPGPMGNGEKWAASARKLGYRVDTTPEVGSIGTWENVKGINHVVYVEQVGPGWIIYSDDTYSNREFRRIKVTVGEKWYPKLFIHFQDALESKPEILAAPSGLTAKPTSDTSLAVDWKAVAGAGGYRVEYATKSDFSNAKVLSAGSQQTAVTGLSASTTYHLRVAAVSAKDPTVTSPYGSVIAASTVAATPTGLVFNRITTDSIFVSWKAVEGAKTYRLQYSTTPDRSDAKYVDVAAPATTTTLSNLRPGTTYTVRAAVAEANGPALGSYTAAPYPVVMTREVPQPTPPATPQRVTMSSVTASSMKVTWQAVPGAAHYRVQYSTKTNRSDAKYVNVAAPATSLSITKLKPNTTYYVRVAVVATNNGAALSAYSPAPYPKAKTAQAKPSTPGGVKITAVSSNTMKVSWKPVAGAAHYRVQYSTKTNRSDAKYANVKGNSTSLTLKRLKRNTRYYVRVAVVAKGNGAALSSYTKAPYPTVKTKK